MFQFTGAGSLHRNKGDGTFEKVEFPKLPTINSRGASWLDINNDGLLDLYVGGYEIWTKTVHPDAIYINQGGGKFAKHWQSKDGNYSARGVTAGDFNEDGGRRGIIGVAFDPEDDNTIWITDNYHAGVESGAYSGGRYGTLEGGPSSFINWYMKEIVQAGD